MHERLKEKILKTPMSLIQPAEDLQCGLAAYPA